MLRAAGRDDLDAVCQLDPIAQTEERRYRRIARGVAAGEVRVVVVDGRIVGYGLMSRSFFDRPFIELVMIDPGYRGAGLGPILIRHLESECPEARLFTSTNESNGHMRHVLEKLGYEPSGIIHNLDPGDPEIVYCRTLDGRRQ